MDTFVHVRMLFGSLLALSIGLILRGVAQIVQRNTQDKQAYWVHIAWVVFVTVYILHFWWWEFALRKISWTFPAYLLVASYEASIFFLSQILIPESIGAHQSYVDYFYARRRWVFGAMTLVFLEDLIDTLIKGTLYHTELGMWYDLRAASLICLCGAAMWTRSRSYHAALVVYALLGQSALIIARYYHLK